MATRSPARTPKVARNSRGEAERLTPHVTESEPLVAVDDVLARFVRHAHPEDVHDRAWRPHEITQRDTVELDLVHLERRAGTEQGLQPRVVAVDSCDRHRRPDSAAHARLILR